MTYSEFVKIYPALDLFLELFKGLGPTLIAILAIVLNHRNSVKRDKENRRNVDGVYFPDYSKLRDFEKLQIFNNGTVELKIDFEIREQNSKSQQLKTERYLIIQRLLG